MAIWGRLTSLVAGIGISRAAGVVLEPALEPSRQKAWLASRAAILDPPDLAMLVAQGFISFDAGAAEALRNGFTEDKFANMVQLALAAAPVAQLLELWRRGAIEEELVDHGLAKAHIEPQYWKPIKTLYTTRVPADLLAFAHQRGIVDNPTDPVTGELLIPVSAPTTDVTNVDGKPSPIQQAKVDLDVLAEFEATGWDFTRAAINARARGLPPAPGELLQLVNRGTISVSEYYVGIGEGDVRNEWRDYLLTLRRRLLTPHEYAELQLRGYLSQDDRDAGAQLSGMEPADAELLYNVLGRSIPVHQITTGLARGGIFDGPTDEIPTEYLQSLQRGNLRPEYYNLGYANRFTVPSYFVLEALLKAGAITPTYGEQLFLELGWPPDLAHLAAIEYAGGTGSSAKKTTAAQIAAPYEAGTAGRDAVLAELQAFGYSPADAETYVASIDSRPVASARQATLTKLRTLYVKQAITRPQTLEFLSETGLTDDTQAGIIAHWDLEAKIVANEGTGGTIQGA
jgi:hypothetical protein